MKRQIGILAALILLVNYSVIYGATTVSMSPSTVASPAVGQQLSFSINITGGLDVGNFRLVVTFDSNALSYTSTTSGSYLGSSAASSTRATSNSVTHSEGLISTGVDGDGTLATVTFSVLEVKGSTIGLSATLYNPQWESISTTAEGATITSAGLSISNVSEPGAGDPGDELTYTVEVQEDGSAASGKTVSFSITAGDGNASLSPASATTDTDGQASTTITLGASASGSYTVTATVDSKSTTGTATVNPPPPKISMSPSTVASPAVGQQLNFSISINGGMDVAGYLVKVTFDSNALSYASISSGGYLGSSATSSTTTTSDSVTFIEAIGATTGVNGNGTLATVTFTVLEVKASTIGLSATLSNPRIETITSTAEGAVVTNPGLSISNVTGPGSGDPGDELTYTVEVQQDGSAASGKTVSFSITSGDGNASLSPESATTDTDGQASTTITLGENASGSYTVTATVDSKSTTGTATVNPPPPEITISVVTAPGSGDPGDELTFTVEVQEDGSAASGKTVSFSITSGDGNATLNPESATTDTDGQASTTITLGNNASGSYTVTATVDSKSTTGTATVNSTSPGISISVVTAPGSGNPGDELTFTVEVQEDGSAASGKTVSFSITSGDSNASLNPESATTDTNGQASTTITLGANASGSYTVTATVDSKSTTGTATVNPPPPEITISVVTAPGSGDPGDELTFTVEVQEDGSAASGKTVSFSITSGDGNASLSPESATTDTNGQASTTITLGENASGSYTVTATADSKSTTGTATVNPPPPEITISVVTAPGSGDPGDELTFTVEVQEDGSAASGKTVSFSITSGDGNASLSPESATTDTNGQASTTITLGENASGSYTVTAAADSKSTSGTATVNPPPPEITISVVTAPGSGDPGDELTFTVEVQEDGSAASGKTVSFSITSGDGNASLSPESATTDTNGQASTTITLGANASGSYTVTASVDSKSTSGTATVNSTSPATTITVITAPGSGDPGDELTFTVEVQEDGSAASGKTVSFSITSGDGNASLNPTDATTDTNGQASTTITLGNNASGIYIITATVDSESINGAATVTHPPAQISMSPSSVESPAVGQQLRFSINITGGLDVKSFGLHVRFDSSALSYVSMASGGYLGSDSNVFSFSANDQVTYSERTSNGGVDGDGTLATVTFTVLEIKDSTIRLSASLTNSSSNSIDNTVEGAAITRPAVSQTGLSISVVSSPGSGNPGDELTFTIEVQEDESAATGKTVTFSITSGDGNASLNPASATTDSNGQASTTITLGNNASGIYIVTATVDSESINGAATVIPPPAEISMSPSSVESPAVGQQVTFDINIKGGLDVKDYGVTVGFDATALSYDSIASGGYLGNTARDSTSTTNNSVSYGESITTGGVDGDGTLATVTFTVLDVKDSTLALSASLSNSLRQIIYTTVEGAAITIPPPPVSPAGLSISVVSSPGSGNPGDELTFTIEVQEDGSAASGKTVSFSITSGDGNASLNPASATTDINGQASTAITLGNNASGIFIVTATVDSESINGAALVIPPPAQISMSPSTVESPAVGQQLTFDINIKGGIDVARFGFTVRFDSTALSYVSITSGNYLGSGARDSTSTINNSVLYSEQITTGAGGDGDGTLATVTFTVLEVKDSTLTLEANLSNSSSHAIDKTVEGAAITIPPEPVTPSGLSISVVTSPGSGNPGDELTFTVQVQEDGSAASGKSVSFSITSGDGNASLNPASATTDTNGQASTTLTLGNNAAGSYTVTAAVGTESVSAAATVQTTMTDQKKDNQQQPQTGLTISVVSSPGTGNPGDTLTFAVEVQADGSAASGKTVSFSITSSDGNASLNPESAATDTKGRASTTITLGENAAGSYRVTAAVGTETVSSTVTVETSTTTSPTPKTLAEVSGNNQSALTGKALANPFVVKILDQHDNLLEGVTVTFSVTAGGGSLSRTSLDTDADGLAKSTLALGSEPGTNTVTASVEGIAETVTFNAVAELLEFDLSVPSGTSLIHVPLKTRTVDGTTAAINSIADLYDALGGADTVKLLITYNRNTQQWNSYLGAGSKGGTADRALAADLGIVASLKSSVTIRIGGDQLGSGGTSTIGLIQGKNLIGLPLRDSRISRVSDLLTLDGIADNADAVTVSVNGSFTPVAQAGDAGDTAITGGQAFILDVSNNASVSISGKGWGNTPANTMAAPLLAAEDINVTGTTPVLAMTGAIVHRVKTTNGRILRVIVKNLSTGITVNKVIEVAGGTASYVAYQLTVVDIKHGRAAAIGDILEISAVSTDNSISAPPLRYTVTAEDVKTNRIQSPELIVQAIPKETQLLPNYPNPFNPETWIPYRLANAAEVTLEIYDAAGNLVRTIDVGFKPAAAYDSRASAIYWDGRNNYGEPIASGVYFYHLFTDAFSAARKMLILK